MGRSSEHINQIENGKMNTTIDFLYDFCNYFDITISDFFNESIAYPTHFKTLFANMSLLNNDEFELIAKLVNIIVQNKD